MMKPSHTFTSVVLGAPGVDPKSLERPSFSGWDAFVAAVNEAVPSSPPCVDGIVMCPDLVSDDGSSQLCVASYRSCCATYATETNPTVVAPPLLPHAPPKPMTTPFLFNPSPSITVPTPRSRPRRPPPSPRHAPRPKHGAREQGPSK